MGAIYKKIAVAIDFSDQSLKAFNRAIQEAKDNEATLQLVNVVDTQSFGSIPAYDLKYADKLKKDNEKQIDQLKNEAIAAGVQTVETVVEKGSPKAFLTQLPNVDLLVCGATGVSGLEKVMIGSVAERIVRLAQCDVLIVR